MEPRRVDTMRLHPFIMKYQFENIDTEMPDDEQIEDLARLFAEIIYKQTTEEMKKNEQAPDNV
jgi:hypothetical protein